jgi:hypothetical protein
MTGAGAQGGRQAVTGMKVVAFGNTKIDAHRQTDRQTDRQC